MGFIQYIKGDSMKNKKNIIVLACVIVALLIAIITTESTDFDLEFAVDQNESTIEAEIVTLKGKLIRLPFDFYYIKGKLYIDEKSYSVEKFKKESYQYNFTMVLIDKDDQEFTYGDARLVGNIGDNTVQSMHIVISKTNMHTGFTHTEGINCQIVNK